MCSRFTAFLPPKRPAARNHPPRHGIKLTAAATKRPRARLACCDRRRVRRLLLAPDLNQGLIDRDGLVDQRRADTLPQPRLRATPSATSQKRRAQTCSHTSANYRGSAQKMFELASQWAVHLALAYGKQHRNRLSDHKSVQRAGKRHICVLAPRFISLARSPAK